MRTLALLILMLGTSHAIVIRNKDGRSIPCELISLDATTATIETMERKRYTVKLSDLDQVSVDRIKDEAKRIEAARPKGIIVSSVIVKRLTRTSLGGTFRYFFDVRNYGPDDFAGTVTIHLIGSINGNPVKKEIFEPSGGIAKGLGKSGSIDSIIGPERVHGDACVSGYTWTVTVGGKEVAAGVGKITDKYSDESDPPEL